MWNWCINARSLMHCGFKNQPTSCKPVNIDSVVEMDMA